MKIIKQTELDQKQKIQIFELWNNEYPEKLAYKTVEEFENYLNNLIEQSHYLLLDEVGQYSGWATTFTRDNEIWFAIIISEKLHGKGIGTKILNNLKEDKHALNGWVIDHNSDKKSNGSIYKSPLDFYIKNNFNVINDTRLELEIMSAVKIKWTK
ncbi:GNAT family N-acetyltransferase [Empedobacter tilapiae]|uniref:GNAT family N-acetyltransferase n=1 Tax=Empedobacter tilapiae TaxID=2491114 RepID=UPI0028D60235|nr:GNAT family N-acetyltransferase [Empedobacter tilapiae]